MQPDSPSPEPSQAALTHSRLSLPNPRVGKVRDVYDLPPEPAGTGNGTGQPRVLMVASDRLSAFDVVLPTPIPGKGRLLTSIAAFWLRQIERLGLAKTHLLSVDAADIPDSAFTPGSTPRSDLQGRITIGRACRVLPVEFVVRGYLEGSGWRDYQQTGSICGVSLPAGLRQCDKLPEPVFTPATKAEQGDHDENINFDDAAARIDQLAGTGTAGRLRDTSLAIYTAAAEHAAARGIIIADTKFEFGLPLGADGTPSGEPPILIDEALTPDSSRFWPADQYEPDHAQPSFDKQYVREYLQSLVDAGAWDKTAPGPELPNDVVAGTLARYQEAADRLTS